LNGFSHFWVSEVNFPVSVLARDIKGHCKAFDADNLTCGNGCRVKSHMTYPLCSKHDKPKYKAAIRAKEYLKPLVDSPLKVGCFMYYEELANVKDCPDEIFKIGVDFGNENCNFESRISKHEEGPCAATFCEAYMTSAHQDCRLVDGFIKKLLQKYQVKFQCNCNSNHVEYYKDEALSIFEQAERWDLFCLFRLCGL
ncbi:17950_t:CDS:2, partial [Racocetra persica]